MGNDSEVPDSVSNDNRKSGDGVHTEHWCSHPGCSQWGGFGFSKTPSEPPVWKCWEHYEHKARR